MKEVNIIILGISFFGMIASFLSFFVGAFIMSVTGEKYERYFYKGGTIILSVMGLSATITFIELLCLGLLKK